MVSVFLLINVLPSAYAQQASDQNTAENAQSSSEKKKQDLGEWWNRNPLTYESVPDDVLIHLEASYNWNRVKGNFTNDKHDFSFLLSLRKKIYTYNFRYALDKRNASRPKSPPHHEDNFDLRKSTKHEIHHDFRLALTNRIIAGCGLLWLQDDWIKVKNQYTYYGGLGFTVFRHPRLKIDTFAALGYEELDHTDEYHENYIKMQDWGNVEGIRYDAGTETSKILYLHQKARCYVTRSLALNQSIDYYVDVDDNDKYRWKFNISADMKIMEHIFASVSYLEEYDNTPESLLGIRKRDTSTSTGVKIVF